MGNHYVAGSHNFICDICGFEYKADKKRKTWDGKIVCIYDWEPRHPQDFVRSKYDKQSVEDSRPRATETFQCEPVYEVDVYYPNTYMECG